MALSNWDTFAMDHENKPCCGVYISPQGISVEIYKNWIYLKDKDWNKVGYWHPVMEIYDSKMSYKDVNIASKFINHTIYVATWSGYNYDKSVKGMVGIGTMGHDVKSQYVGVTAKHLIRLKKFLNSRSIVYSVEIPQVLKNLNLQKGKRFNQGDKFFSKTIGTDIQCSSIDEAKEPIFSRLIKNMKVD